MGSPSSSAAASWVSAGSAGAAGGDRGPLRSNLGETPVQLERNDSQPWPFCGFIDISLIPESQHVFACKAGGDLIHYYWWPRTWRSIRTSARRSGSPAIRNPSTFSPATPRPSTSSHAIPAVRSSTSTGLHRQARGKRPAGRQKTSRCTDTSALASETSASRGPLTSSPAISRHSTSLRATPVASSSTITGPPNPAGPPRTSPSVPTSALTSRSVPIRSPSTSRVRSRVRTNYRHGCRGDSQRVVI